MESKTKVTGLTNYLIDLPSARKSMALMVLVSAATGAATSPFLARSFALQGFLSGALLGFALLGLPAILAAFLTSLATRRTRKSLNLKRSTYLAFFGMAIVTVLYAIGTVNSYAGIGQMFDFLIYGYVFIFAVRFFVFIATNPYGAPLSAALASIHSIVGFAFLLSIGAFLLPTAPSMLSFILKVAVSLGVFALGILIFIKLVDAPMKRNIGIGTFELSSMFISNWYDGSLAIEGALTKIGEKIDTLLGVIAFKTRRGIKAVFAVPYLHPGPFGDVGGARLSAVMTDRVEKATGSKLFVFHGTANHDMNPTSARTLKDLSDVALASLKGMKWGHSATRVISHREGDVHMLGQAIGDGAYLISTLSPHATEDIEMSIGQSVMATGNKHFANVLHVDAHNCHRPGDHAIYSGNPVVFDLMRAADVLGSELKEEEQGRLLLGVATDPMKEYSVKDGIGPTGLRVAVLQVGNYRTAYVLFDANNIMGGIRDKIIDAVHGLVDECEVMTTDSHCVNTVRGVDNPLGMHINESVLIERAQECVKRALADVEPVDAGMRIERIKGVSVFGAQKPTEVVSTVNSIIAMMKILSPMIFGLTLVLSLLGVFVIPW